MASVKTRNAVQVSNARRGAKTVGSKTGVRKAKPVARRRKRKKK